MQIQTSFIEKDVSMWRATISFTLTLAACNSADIKAYNLTNNDVAGIIIEGPPETPGPDQTIIEAPVIVEETSGGGFWEWLVGGDFSNRDSANTTFPEVPKTVFSSRAFATLSTFEAREFAGFGLVHFPNSYNSENAERFHMFCGEFRGTLRSVEDFESPPTPIERSKQMVTIWPIRDQEVAFEIERQRNIEAEMAASGNKKRAEEAGERVCSTASQGYQFDPDIANVSGSAAFSGRGPFLIAWAPGASKGTRNQTALVMDLSDVESASVANKAFVDWRIAVENRRQDWSTTKGEDGVRDILRDFANRSGTTILKLVNLG